MKPRAVRWLAFDLARWGASSAPVQRNLTWA